MKVCDTTVLVDIDGGGIPEKVRRLEDEGRHVISAVTVTELRLGANLKTPPDDPNRNTVITGLDRLLSRFEIEPISRSVAEISADIVSELRRRGEPLDDLHDVHIAATARTNNLPVLTANGSHFERVTGIDVIDWRAY